MGKTITCAACGAAVNLKSYDFKAEHACSQKGLLSGRSCPECKGPTVWRVGMYSTFHGCQDAKCGGKIGSPRGKAAATQVKASPPQEFAKDEDIPESHPETVVVAEKEQTEMTGQKDLGQALLEAMGPALAHMVMTTAKDAVAKAIAEAGLKSVKIDWVDPKTQSVVAHIDGGHMALAKVIDLIKCGFKNILLVGPAGSGKTTLAADTAKALGRRFGHISCSAGMSESYLTGRAIPNLTTGQTAYETTEFVDIYENGGVFLFDEVDAADPNVLLVINSAIANGHMGLAARTEKRTATRHEDTIILAAANTYGTGADRMYVGRNQLDAAFLDRYVGAIVTVDYDKELEKAFLTRPALEKLWVVREHVQSMKIRRVVGTRAVVAIARHMTGGKTQAEAFKAVFSTDSGWTQDELTRVGLAP